MVSMSDVVAFLWNLMHNDAAKSHFEHDPQGALDECGLGGVTARDIRDAQMVMQDQGLAHPSGGGPTSGGHDDPVDEIRHTSTTYEIDRSMTIDNNQVFTVVDIDQTTINDDSTTEVTAIQDNDTTTNNVEVTAIDDSFNDDSSAQDTEDDSETSDTATDSDADEDAAADPDAEDDTSVHADEDTADDSEADTSLDTEDEDGAYHTLPAPDAEPVTEDAEVVGCYAGEEMDSPVG
jgi:hypothetical protein